MSTNHLVSPLLTSRFENALVYATRLHAHQQRKDTGIPYVAHLLGVTALVIEDGGDEDQAIAALLHDAVEDQGGRPRLEEIGRRYGERVAAIVEGCTDWIEEPGRVRPPWRERKERYIAHLGGRSAEVLRVSAADKLYNARAILGDYRRLGDLLFESFSGGKSGVLWYYTELVVAYHGTALRGYLSDELERVVSELVALARRRG